MTLKRVKVHIDSIRCGGGQCTGTRKQTGKLAPPPVISTVTEKWPPPPPPPLLLDTSIVAAPHNILLHRTQTIE